VTTAEVAVFNGFRAKECLGPLGLKGSYLLSDIKYFTDS